MEWLKDLLKVLSVCVRPVIVIALGVPEAFHLFSELLANLSSPYTECLYLEVELVVAPEAMVAEWDV
jgi:uncharacterized protein involved in cysteine biosynthesis